MPILRLWVVLPRRFLLFWDAYSRVEGCPLTTGHHIGLTPPGGGQHVMAWIRGAIRQRTYLRLYTQEGAHTVWLSAGRTSLQALIGAQRRGHNPEM